MQGRDWGNWNCCAGCSNLWVLFGFFSLLKSNAAVERLSEAGMTDLHPGHSTCHPSLLALGTSGTCGQGWGRVTTPVRGDSCVPCEPTQPLLHHPNPKCPQPGSFPAMQDHGTAPAAQKCPFCSFRRKDLGTEGHLLQQGHPQLGRFAHEPAVN